MISRRIALFLISASLAFGSVAIRAETAPDALIKQVSTEVLDAVKADKSIKAGDVQKIIALHPRLRLIDAALSRMDAGTYGACVDCGDDIPIERLEALRHLKKVV